MDVVWQDAPFLEPASWLIQYEFDGQIVLSIARTQSGYLVRSHGVADFVVSREVARGRLSAGVEVSEGQIAFERQVLPATFQLAGACAVHASAVRTEHGAVAFIGPSGAGKSTLAAFLATSGWSLISDDYLPLEQAGAEVTVRPTSGTVRLREVTAERLGEPGVWHWGKLAVERPVEARPARLIAIYAIAEQETLTIEPLRRAEAAARLAQNLLRLDPHDPELLRAELDFVEEVANAVPMQRLAYPRRFDGMEAVRTALVQDLASREGGP